MITLDNLITFGQITDDHNLDIGGKARNLAYLYQRGYNIPNGFVLLPHAFDQQGLNTGTRQQVVDQLNRMRTKIGTTKFVARSSGHDEDSTEASYAGEYESILNLQSDAEVLEAIDRVYLSKNSRRVQQYRMQKGIVENPDLSVIVQIQIDVEISGVVFTADPITGDQDQIVGNYHFGMGDRLVSGDVNPLEFRISKIQDQFEGDENFEPIARLIWKVSKKIEQEFNEPQDIEWGIIGDELFIFQSRPISTLSEGDLDRWDLNISQGGNYVWTNKITADLFPIPMKPATWSVFNIFFENMGMGDRKSFGLIAGIPYVNISLLYSMLMKVYKNERKSMKYLKLILDDVPLPLHQIQIPTRLLLFNIIPKEIRGIIKKWRLRRRFETTLVEMKNYATQTMKLVSHANVEKLQIVINEALHKFADILTLQDYFNEQYYLKYQHLLTELNTFLTDTEVKQFLSHFSVDREIDSLGPLMGISKIIDDQMSPTEYMDRYGHRSVYENYLSYPRPYENPSWLDKQRQRFEQSGIDIRERLQQSHRHFYEEFRELIQKRSPGKEKQVSKYITAINRIIYRRERTRSEVTRILSLFREIYLRVSDILDMGEDIFFFRVEELCSLLEGDISCVSFLSIRKHNYEESVKIQPLPSWISGRFDPFLWVQDKGRNLEIFDQEGEYQRPETIEKITGYAGSAGIVEGRAQVMSTPDEVEDIPADAILVTKTTNVGWTPVFGMIKGVVTDTGAVLSHAAIVARELGVPAVVGCRIATSLIQTGDKIRINGNRGTVEIIEKAAGSKDHS